MTGNGKAEERYAQLVNAIDFVTEQFEPLDKLIARMRENPARIVAGHAAGEVAEAAGPSAAEPDGVEGPGGPV